VKLLSRFVKSDRLTPARILFKGAADATGKAVTLVITIVAARRLNADPFGVMAYAMATGWLLGVATDAGLSMHLARETARLRGFAASARQARDDSSTRQLLFEVVSLRTGLAFFAATAAALLAPYMVPAHWRMQFVLLVLAQLAGAVAETIAHYFRGIQRSEIEAAIHSTHRLVTLVWALIVLWIWRRLDYLAIAMLVPPLLAIVVSMVIAARLSANDRASAETTLLTPSRFFRDVFPLGAGVLISALYFRIDVYFIQQWYGFQQVGGYNAAFRLVEALRLLPAAVLAVTFPMLVTASDTQVVRRIGTMLTAVGAVLAIVCALGGSIIMPLIYGDTYAYAAPAFSILALALPLFFLNYALTHQVIGWDGQIAYLFIATLALIANVAANLVLIPTQGINGAAIATVLTEVVVTIGCVITLVRHTRSTQRFVANVRFEGSL